jgi:hypothetical protein
MGKRRGRRRRRKKVELYTGVIYTYLCLSTLVNPPGSRVDAYTLTINILLPLLSPQNPLSKYQESQPI